MRQTPTILVVDDHKPTADSTAELLNKIHPKWVVLTAYSVKEALDYIEKNSLDALVTDWKLNEHKSAENGFIPIKAALKKDPFCVTILITAYPGEFDRYKDAFAIGVYDCISKRQEGIRVTREIAIKLHAALERRWAHAAADFYARHIDHVLRDKLGATNRHSKLNDRFLTVMFTDIRKFSRISDQLSDHRDTVADFIGKLYDAIVRCTHSNKGIVDKFMGDGAMLLFGAFDADTTIHNVDHAQRACRAALQLQVAVSPLLEEFVAKASRAQSAVMPTLSLGIGINTAPALVGIVQTAFRDQYTALGHGVNLAKRIESYAGKESNIAKGKKKHVYGNILVTLPVRARVEEYFDLKSEPNLKDIHNVSEEHQVWSLMREKPQHLVKR